MNSNKKYALPYGLMQNRIFKRSISECIVHR